MICVLVYVVGGVARAPEQFHTRRSQLFLLVLQVGYGRALTVPENMVQPCDTVHFAKGYPKVYTQRTVECAVRKHRLLTRSPAARGGGTDKQKTFLHTHRTRRRQGGAPPHPRKEKALLPAAMARGESGRSPIGAGAGAATGTGSPGSCATISATAPSGTWLSDGEGEGAGASEGEGQLS